MKRIRMPFVVVGLLVLVPACAYFISKYVAFPLRHDARQEQFLNTHLLKVERQGNSVKLVGDISLPCFMSGATNILHIDEEVTCGSRHSIARYTLQRIEADSAIIEFYSQYYQGYRRLQPGERDFVTSRGWVKLKWR